MAPVSLSPETTFGLGRIELDVSVGVRLCICGTDGNMVGLNIVELEEQVSYPVRDFWLDVSHRHVAFHLLAKHLFIFLGNLGSMHLSHQRTSMFSNVDFFLCQEVGGPAQAQEIWKALGCEWLIVCPC